MTFEALAKLIKKNDVDSLQREIDLGASPGHPNQYGWTLLMLAAMKGNRSIGEILISCGADINAINNFGETALSLAAHAGHIPFIRVLLASGASIVCRPHGNSLENWLKASSGLPDAKIAAILELINSESQKP